MAEDTFKTITDRAEGYYTEKRSKFISYAVPVRSVEEVKEELAKYRKEYYDARHVCWAYMLGPDRKTFRANDDGEPSSTAGKPILGQINSNELTDIFKVQPGRRFIQNKQCVSCIPLRQLRRQFYPLAFSSRQSRGWLP